ncbi:MAG: nucleotide sugar dehydrogenase [Bacteroidia bacterium]|nr:nucleotide sugar dehydrogenase [Bacteroidia bacterium]
MNISIFGLGYVGCVGMGCLAAKGHNVVGVDVSEEKIRLINDGKPTIVEKDIDVLIEKAHREGMIKATNDYVSAVKDTEISFLCVGTPSAPNGHLNLDFIMQTAREIGEALRQKDSFHVVVIRSTVFPGTNAKVSSLIEELSGKKRNADFAVVSNPEFLREGTAVKDYLNPPLTVLGSECKEAIEILKKLYESSGAPIEVVDIEVAEMIKYVNNSYHALKVVFGNEIGRICKALNVDSHEVMRLFCMDRQLNISPYYFMPGFAYGGSCLPKDLKGLKTLAHDLYLDTPVLNAIDESNQIHLQSAISYIENLGKRKIGVLGLSFKAGTDDMRNSPIVNVIEYLHGKGYEIKIYDKNVSISRLLGKNKSVIAEKLPHLNVMLQDNLEEVTDWAELLVVSNKDEVFKSIKPKKGQIVYDLARVSELEDCEGYNGLCW